VSKLITPSPDMHIFIPPPAILVFSLHHHSSYLAYNTPCSLLFCCSDPQWIEVGDERGDTPLHAAAISDSADVLGFLLSCEVNPDLANKMGFTSAHIARSGASLDLLYRWGGTLYCIDSDNRLPLFLAARDGRDDCVKYLCRATPQEYLLWADAEGNNPLHIAAMNGHHKCIEELCRWIPSMDCFYAVNMKGYTAAHVASTQAVLQTLYENGADLWVKDAKLRFPLFMASFHGRVDCLLFLLELGMQKREDVIGWRDKQGDTVLHATCLCGHFRCAVLLLYFLRDAPNGAGLTPRQLAARAGHHEVADLVGHVESKRLEGYNTLQVFNCTFESLSPVIQYYGSRWTKLYDHSSDSLYYFDRITNSSQWDRPVTYDETKKDEKNTDTAREVLKKFYIRFNREKLKDVNEILFTFRTNYTEMFLQLANRYNLTDLSMFEGVIID
jgi:ankyrin repeat protein